MYTLSRNSRLGKYLTCFDHPLPDSLCSLVTTFLKVTGFLLMILLVVSAVLFLIGDGLWASVTLPITEWPFHSFLVIILTALLTGAYVFEVGRSKLLERAYQKAFDFYTNNPHYVDDLETVTPKWSKPPIGYVFTHWMTQAEWGNKDYKRRLIRNHKIALKAIANPKVEDDDLIPFNTWMDKAVQVVADVYNAVRGKACVPITWTEEKK